MALDDPVWSTGSVLIGPGRVVVLRSANLTGGCPLHFRLTPCTRLQPASQPPLPPCLAPCIPAADPVDVRSGVDSIQSAGAARLDFAQARLARGAPSARGSQPCPLPFCLLALLTARLLLPTHRMQREEAIIVDGGALLALAGLTLVGQAPSGAWLELQRRTGSREPHNLGLNPGIICRGGSTVGWQLAALLGVQALAHGASLGARGQRPAYCQLQAAPQPLYLLPSTHPPPCSKCSSTSSPTFG